MEQTKVYPTNTIRTASDRRRYHFTKRMVDVVFAAVGLVVLLIPMALIALLVRLESPGPAICIHERIGKNGKPLRLLKFRTMYADAEKRIAEFSPAQMEEWRKNFKLEDDPRITRIGKFLRRSSMDELPQLVNILKGELSLVGPRPVVGEELLKYGENRDKFLSVTPGLTGYWQAYARSTCTYEKRIEMELYYVDHACFWWDIRIMFHTVWAVLSGFGAK